MSSKRTLLTFIALLLFSCAMRSIDARVTVDQMFSFGMENGDLVINSGVHGSSPPIDLQVNYTFYNNAYSRLWVNVNGVLSFQSALSTDNYAANCSLAATRYRAINVFYSDVHFGNRSNIFYRQSTNASVLQKATGIARQAFPDFTGSVTWTLIATWLNVTTLEFPNCTMELPRNTFQAVLARTDTGASFVFYLYNDLKWTGGWADGSPTCDGLGGTNPAMIGFDAGDGVNFVTLPGSCTDDVLAIADRSNMGVSGMWAFEVGKDAYPGATCGADGVGGGRRRTVFFTALNALWTVITAVPLTTIVFIISNRH